MDLDQPIESPCLAFDRPADQVLLIRVSSHHEFKGA
jgi:hypothetical protein